MQTLTAAQRSLVTVAARGFSVTARTELKSHAAIRDLAASGLSIRDITAALKATGAQFAPSASRVGVIVKTLKALPDDVTAEDYSAALKDATRAASGDTSRKRPTAAPAAPTTAADIVLALAALVTAATALDAADRAFIAQEFAVAAQATMPTVTAVAA